MGSNGQVHAEEEAAAAAGGASAPYEAAMKASHRESQPLGVEITRMRRRLKKAEGMSIDPHHKFGRRWDFTTMVALVFTAIVTPVEVAFEAHIALWSVMFVVNRAVDAIFVVDVVLNFFIAYRDEKLGGALVRSQRLIARNYLHGWFCVDVVSIVPFEFLDTPGEMKAFRLVRLLRLLKLARVLKASRLLAKYETSVSLSFAQRDILKMSVLVMLVAHWSACVWGLADVVVRDDIDTDVCDDDISIGVKCSQTWVNYVTSGKNMDPVSVHDRYIVALYFSIYTLTSVGFGDIIAVNITEVYACLVLMIFGSVFWAYIIGNFCSIVASSDVFGIEFRQRMDELNRMMRERRFDPLLAQRCRMYYIESKEMKRVINYRRLEEEMSVEMRGEVALANNQAWLSKVWYLNSVRPPFVVELSQTLLPMTYAPMETVQIHQMLFIVRRGIAAKLGVPMSTGSVWGHDFVVRDVRLVDTTPASALTYVEVLALARARLMQLLDQDKFEDERRVVQRACVWYSARAKLILRGRAMRKREAGGSQRRLGFGEVRKGSHSLSRAVTAEFDWSSLGFDEDPSTGKSLAESPSSGGEEHKIDPAPMGGSPLHDGGFGSLRSLRELTARDDAVRSNRHAAAAESAPSSDSPRLGDGGALTRRMDRLEAHNARIESQLGRVLELLEVGAAAPRPRPSSPLPPLENAPSWKSPTSDEEKAPGHPPLIHS